MLNTLFVHTTVAVCGFLLIGDYCRNRKEERDLDLKRKELDQCFQRTFGKPVPNKISDWTVQQIVPCEKEYLSYIKVAIR